MDAEALRELEDMEDSALLLAHQTGSEHALRILMGRYRNEIYGYLCRYTGNKAIAEDAFQETFLQVHLAGHTYDASRPFRPWLYAIATNKARDIHRRTKRHKLPSLDAPIGRDEDSTGASLLPDTSEGVSVDLERSETAARVRTIVDAMPALHREILILGYFQRMNYQQIADVLEIPLGTVKSRLHSAVARFSDSWMRANEDRRGTR